MRSARKKYLALAALALLATLLTISAISLARHRIFENRWGQVHVGMSKAEVRQVLGEPDHVYPAGSLQSNSIAGTLLLNFLFNSVQEKWAYGRRRLIVVQGSFPFIDLAPDGFFVPEDADHVVYFSDDGRVLKTQYPYRVADSVGSTR